jgi:hypothetical protein
VGFVDFWQASAEAPEHRKQSVTAVKGLIMSLHCDRGLHNGKPKLLLIEQEVGAASSHK